MAVPGYWLGVLATGLALHSPGVPGQTGTLRPPSLGQQGTAAAMYGRCMTDVLSPDLLRSALVLGAFSQDVAGRLVRGADEMTQIALMCSQQIHQHRCSAKIVAVAGDVWLDQAPAAANATRPQMNTGAVLGGVVGGLGGLLLGTGERGNGSLPGMVIGGYAGAKFGESKWTQVQAVACVGRQRQLDALSTKLQGTLPRLSVAGLTTLIEANIRQRTLSQQEAAILVTEANKLADKGMAVFQAMQ
jgi:hypothetical protein